MLDDIGIFKSVISAVAAGLVGFVGYSYRRMDKKLEKLDDIKIDKDHVQDKLLPIQVLLTELKEDVKEIKRDIKDIKRGK